MRRLLLAAALGVAACTPPPPCPVVAYAAGTRHSVVVAVAESLLAQRPAAARPRACLRLAAQASYDQVDQPDAEVSLAESLVADPQVVAVVGHMRSRGSLAAAPVYARAGVPQLVPASTSALLRAIGPWTFVLSPGEEDQAAFLAATLETMRLRRVLVFFSGEAYGEGLVAALRPRLAARHIAEAAAIRVGPGADVATLAEAAFRGRRFDGVVLLTDYMQAAGLAKVAVARRPGIPLVAGDGAMYPAGLRQLGGAAAESLQVVSLWTPDTADAGVRDYLRWFRRIAGRAPTPSEAFGHDALLYALAAIEAAGPDRSAIRQWLAGDGGARPVPGQVTDRRLHDGGPPRMALVRIGPAATP